MNKKEVALKARMLRVKMGEDMFSPIDVFSMCLSIPNLTLVFAKLGQNISGMYYRGEASCVIAINSEMSLGRQYFSMAHELYHYYTNEQGTVVCHKNTMLGNETEKMADQFAAYLLMPEEGILSVMSNMEITEISKADVIKMEQYFHVSHAAMLNRLKDCGLITGKQYDEYKENAIRDAAFLDYDISLYQATNIEKTYGYYISSARRLKESGKISEKKWKEMLICAFREDIVNGSEQLAEDAFE